MKIFAGAAFALLCAGACVAQTNGFAVKSVVLQEKDFTAAVRRGREQTADGAFGCECRSKVVSPVFVGDAPGLASANAVLRRFATRFVVKKFDEDACVGNEVSFSTHAAGPAFVSVEFHHEWYCGAYPNDEGYGLTFDAATGRRLAFHDVVPRARRKEIDAYCTEQRHRRLCADFADRCGGAAYRDKNPNECGGEQAKSTAAECASTEPFAADGVLQSIENDGAPLDLSDSFYLDAFAGQAVILVDSKFRPHAMGSFACRVPFSMLPAALAAKLR
jgi:hypothetical protein